MSSFEPGTNFGTAEWFYGIGLPSYHVGYIAFDLSGIPANATVYSAHIALWGRYMDGTIAFSPLATPWSELAVTWANQPSEVTPSMAASYPISRGAPSGDCYMGCVKSFDVTAIVQAWVGQSITNNGLKIIGNTPGIGWLMAACENLSYPRPALTVQYEVITPTLPGSWGKVKTLYR